MLKKMADLLFQFLIGILKTKNSKTKIKMRHKFQFLIGILKTN